MPEQPDLQLYRACSKTRIVDEPLRRLCVGNPLLSLRGERDELLRAMSNGRR